MTLHQFVRTHRTTIDETARAQCDNLGRLNDEDREEWVVNDETLYNLARAKGVSFE